MPNAISVVIQAVLFVIPLAVGLIGIRQYWPAKLWIGLSAVVAILEIAIYLAGLNLPPWVRGCLTVIANSIIGLAFLWSARWWSDPRRSWTPY